MTTTITSSVARMPNSSASAPMMSSMIGARMIASTNVGQDQEEVRDAHQDGVGRPPT